MSLALAFMETFVFFRPLDLVTSLSVLEMAELDGGLLEGDDTVVCSWFSHIAAVH